MRTRWFCMALSAVFFTGAAASASEGLAPRTLAPKGTFSIERAGVSIERIVVKFHEGTRVRLRDGALVHLPGAKSERERQALARRSLSDEVVQKDLATVARLMAGSPSVQRAERLFTAAEDLLDVRRALGEMRSGQELADLNLYAQLLVRQGTLSEHVRSLVAAIEELPSVEIAYAAPVAEPAITQESEVGISGLAPNLQPEQGYLTPAPIGVDAAYAWTRPGGRGTGIPIVDVEGAWRSTHEDLPTFFHMGGTQLNDLSWRNHGTAVLGEVAARANGYGVTGIANEANIGCESIGSQSAASAITNAALAVGAEGVVIIELHAQGPANSSPCTCNASQCDYIAMEYWPAEFDAILHASVNGTIVVEAAGNGSSDLDDPVYGGRFSEEHYSGAILVGASTSTTRAPTCWTNFGSRITVHGWGEAVTTLGYGDRFNGGSEDSYYTGGFSGTSSATPIVAGSVAALFGALKAAGRGPLSPLTVRYLFRATGTPQAASSKQIGPLPNLRAALNALGL